MPPMRSSVSSPPSRPPSTMPMLAILSTAICTPATSCSVSATTCSLPNSRSPPSHPTRRPFSTWLPNTSSASQPSPATSTLWPPSSTNSSADAAPTRPPPANSYSNNNHKALLPPFVPSTSPSRQPSNASSSRP